MAISKQNNSEGLLLTPRLVFYMLEHIKRGIPIRISRGKTVNRRYFFETIFEIGGVSIKF